MRFSKKIQLNMILKIIFKSFIISLILLVICLDLGMYLSKIKNDGWIINWDGSVAIYGNNYGLFISNYFISFSTVTHLFTLLYLSLAVINHKGEAKGKVQSYPVGLFILLSELFNLISFFCIVLPTADNIGHLPWASIAFSKIIIPVLIFTYVMILMENKSWYGVIETILRAGFRIFSIFMGVVVFYFIIWLSKFIGHANENIFMINNKDLQEDQILENIRKITGMNISDDILKYIGPHWNNHDVINGDVLFHFSVWKSTIIDSAGEWIGPIFAIIIFFVLSFGILPLLAILNNKVVNSPKYLVINTPTEDHTQVIDLRDEVDTMDLTPILSKKIEDEDFD